MSRGKTIAVIMKKGGAGKSTLTVNLSSGLVKLYGKKQVASRR